MNRRIGKIERNFDRLEGRALMTLAAAGTLHSLATTTSSNQAFVNQLFSVVLGRSPSSGELTDITNRLDTNKITKEELALGVLNSKEDLTKLVETTYQNTLGSAPSTAQLQAGIKFLASRHGSLNALSAMIYGTTQYRTSNSITTNGSFVTNVAGDQGVTLTSAQQTYLVDQLNSGAKNSTQAAREIINSNEALTNQIDSLYTDYLSSTPTTTEVNNAFAVVGRGNRWGLRLSLIFSSGFVSAS